MCKTGKREPERAGQASEAVGNVERRPTTTCRRAEQRATGGTQRLTANAS